MNLNFYAENLGESNIFIFVMTDLKQEIKEDIVFVMKAKLHIFNAPLKQHLFDFLTVKCCIQLKTDTMQKL